MKIANLADPFPTETLDQVAFERFIAALLSKLHPDAVVRRAGESGHKQDGLDVTVLRPDGTLHSFQCKRVVRFGPADVAKAVAAHSGSADRKHLVLSRTASPQATRALASNPDWVMLDKEDIGRIIRLELSHDDQDRLVDVFFPGMRLQLLGRSEASQWLTTGEFFGPFVRPEATISHDLPLQSRDNEADRLAEVLANPVNGMVLLVGPGGGGKSRVLLEVLSRFERRDGKSIVRWLSAGGAGGGRAGLDALGRGPKLLVVDDAHDRDGDELLGLFEHAAASGTSTRLILAARPYAAARITQQAARFSMAPVRVDLKPLDRDQMRALANAATASGSELSDASFEQVMRVAGDCPLILMMAARLVARHGSAAILATAGDGFRNAVLGRFADVMAGNIGKGLDREAVRRVLAVLALVQPFHVDDARLHELVQATERVAAADVPRLLRLLEEGGVIYRRGGVHRLMPDVLADYIIEDAYVGPGRRLAPNAGRMLAEAPAGLVENVLVNLGRLDWRLTDGATAASHLLDAAWAGLDVIEDHYDPRLSAVAAVAYYQPRQALRFVRRKLRSGRPCKDPAAILRRVAYDYDTLDEACDLLWRLGRMDAREPSSHHDHPMRALIELCGYEDGKPIAYSERVFRWALAQMEAADAWDAVHSPMDVAAAILGTEIVKTTSDDRQVTMTTSLMNPEAVRPLRKEFVALLLRMLADARPSVGCQAAFKLGEALRHPIGMFGRAVPDEITAAYDEEFAATLAQLRDAVRQGLHPAVAIAVARAVNWHADHGRVTTRTPAAAVLDAMPKDLLFRTRLALADGFGQLALGAFNPSDWRERQDDWLAGLAAELRTARPDAGDLLRFIEAALDDLAVSLKPENSTHMLVFVLIRGDISFARALVGAVSESTASPLMPSAAMALGFLLDRDPAEGRAIATTWLAAPGYELKTVAARALSAFQRMPEEADAMLIGTALRADHPGVVGAGLQALSAWRGTKQRVVIELALSARLGDDADLADLFALVLCHGPVGLLDELYERDTRRILALLLPIPRLDGHWVGELIAGLSPRYAVQVADFVMERVEIAAGDARSAYQPIGRSFHDRAKMDLLAGKDGPQVLAKCWAWLRSSLDQRGSLLAYHAQTGFEIMFLRNSDGLLAAFFAARVGSASAQELRTMGQILRHASPGFIFDRLDFVNNFLTRCAGAGGDVRRAAQDALFMSATSGLRTSIGGRPCAQDVDTAARAAAASLSVPPHSYVADLLDQIQRDAEERINEQADVS